MTITSETKTSFKTENTTNAYCVSSELPNIIGKSQVMRDIATRVLKVARNDVNVMISGESGTGKELIARNIHYHSPRRNAPFIPVDCVALPATLLESELFGFEKGAFTGAVHSKPGLFELANRGTLFLDEITELDHHLQAKLLRVLQERKFRRIGGKDFINVDVRIISATNRNPEQAVEEKWLRQDLYFRLNVVPVFLPPLRQRLEDIETLVAHFIRKYNPFASIEIKSISDEAITALKAYEWPGNVRELENIVQRMISLTDHADIETSDIPSDLNSLQFKEDNGALINLPYKEAKARYVEEFTVNYLTQLMNKYKHNITHAAGASGLSRAMLYRLLQKFNI